MKTAVKMGMYSKSFHHILFDLLTSISRKIINRRSYICSMPFNSVSYTPDGFVHCCHTNYIGRYKDFNSAQEFMDSKKSVELRKSLLKGDYSKCPKTCHVVMNSDRIKAKFWHRPVVSVGSGYGKFWYLKKELFSNDIPTITAMHEDSCGLYCSMCREEVKGNCLSNDLIESLWFENKKTMPGVKYLGLGGSGEPLTQKHALDILTKSSQKDIPNLKVLSIITNGLHFNEQLWKKISPFIKDKFALQISVDAVTQHTYEKIRRGGNFNTLIENLKFASSLKLHSFSISMVVQKDNYFEMREFIDFAQQFNATSVFGEVKHCPDKACHIPGSEHYSDFLKIISDNEFEKQDVSGNFILDIRKKEFNK